MKLRVHSFENKAGQIQNLEDARDWDYYDPGMLVVVERQLVRSYAELREIASRESLRDREFLDVDLMVTLTGG